MSNKDDKKIELVQQDQEKPNQSSFYDLELGEYFLHFYIQETTGLYIDDEVDLILKITAFGETKVTKVLPKQGPGSQTFWGEHIFFNKKFDVRQDLENANYTIQILDHHSLTKDDIIGETGSSIMQIYTEKQHTVYNKWSILANSRKSFKKPMGFLKYSVSFTKSSDPKINLETQSLANESSMTKLSIPPNIQLKKKQIVIKLYKGERIVKMDDSGKADPYVKFYLGGLEIKSKKITQSLNPVFQQKLYLPTIYPTISQNLKMSFKDYDRFGKNDFIGSYYFKLIDIEREKYKFPKWTYFYGAPKKVINEDIEKKMNQYPEISSCFKGALLLSIEMQDTDEPNYLVQEFDQKDASAIDSLKTVNFTARFDIEFIQNFGVEGKEDFQICLNWGGKQEFIKLKNPQRKVFIVYRRIEINQEFQISEEGENGHDWFSQLPNVIVSICQDNKHLCFYRFNCKNYQLSRSDYKDSFIVDFKADNSVSKLAQNYAGQLRLKCAVSLSQDFLALDDQTWPIPAPRPSFEKIRIICYYYQAKKLVASDSSGNSDPYLEFYHLGSSLVATTYPKTLNPSWNEKFVLESYVVDGTLPPMIVNVWDRDVTFMGDIDKEYMGSTIINLDQSFLAQNTEDIYFKQKPKWYDIQFNKHEKAGKILLGFTVVTKKFFEDLDKTGMMGKITKIPLQKSPHHIKINILGFRALESTGILPVRRVKCEINTSSIKDLLKMQEGAAFTDLVAVSKTSGCNPTIGSVLSLTAQLPTCISHQPSLSCQVTDQGIAWLGLSTLIGTFEINIAAYSYISKMMLLQKLTVLLKKQEELLLLHPSSAKYGSNLIILKQLIDKLQRATKSTEGLIQQTDKNVYDRSQRNTNYKLQITQEEREKGAFRDESLFEKSEEKESIYTQEKIVVMSIGQQKKLNLDEDSELEETKESILGAPKSINFSGFMKHESKQEELDDVLVTEIKQKIGGKEKGEPGTDKFKVDLYQKFQKALESQKPVIIKPQYKEIKRLGETNIIEENVPNPFQYYSLGFRSKIRDTKHYRMHVNSELENTRFMGDEVFTTIDLHRGKRLAQKEEDFISRLLHTHDENYRKTGMFRGNVEIIEDSDLQEIMKLDITEQDREILELPVSLENWKYSKLDNEMLKTVDVVIRIYIIDAQFEQNMDINSANDSYVVVQLGDKVIEDTRVIDDQNNPKIFKCFEFEHTLPGASNLSVRFMDKDSFKADELIGETNIDIERRFFDKSWRSHADNPIEKRKLTLPQYSTPQGSMRCWVDIFPKNEIQPKYDISPRPQVNLELRVVVWEVYDVPHMDFEEVSDLYVKVQLPSIGTEMNTDTHFRAQNGFGSFNWRTIFKLGINEYVKPEMLRVNFRIYDKDLLSPDDFHSDVTVDIAQLVQDVLQNEQRRRYLGQGINGEAQSKRVCLTTVVKDKKKKDDKPTRLVVSIDCLTEEEAKQSPAGIGRSDPNQDPYLPEPTGRFEFTLNPFKLLNQLVGPGFRDKLCMIIFVVLLVALGIFFLPGLITSLLANLFI